MQAGIFQTVSHKRVNGYLSSVIKYLYSALYQVKSKIQRRKPLPFLSYCFKGIGDYDDLKKVRKTVHL
ncbi:hypothetical protein QF004_000963 [Chryseobacterium sp. MDT2-18]|nr:hypothetical protein [Chryseobacterium sp. MDT2-18]